jgi:hypothetical protein
MKKTKSKETYRPFRSPKAVPKETKKKETLETFLKRKKRKAKKLTAHFEVQKPSLKKQRKRER